MQEVGEGKEAGLGRGRGWEFWSWDRPKVSRHRARLLYSSIDPSGCPLPQELATLGVTLDKVAVFSLGNAQRV